MVIFNMKVEQQNNLEMLINGENWQHSRAKPEIKEEVIARLPLDQQWVLLSALRQVVARLEHCYREKRTELEGSPSEKERFERMKRTNTGLRKRYAPGTSKGGKITL